MMFGDPLPLDYPEIDKLEEKVNKLIQFVQKLYSENKELKHQKDDIFQKNKEQQETINALREQCSRLQSIEDNTMLYKKREENIRIKIQNMLNKLDNFQSD